MSGPLSAADLAEIHQVLGLYPHAFDNKDDEALALVFASDAVVEITRGPGSVWRGLSGIRQLAHKIADASMDHHTVNTYVFVDEAGTVRARSRYIVILADRTVHNGDYLDELVETPDGWRISRRISVPRFPIEDRVDLPRETLDAWCPPGAR